MTKKQKTGAKAPFLFHHHRGGVSAPARRPPTQERGGEREGGVAGQAATDAAPATRDTTRERERELERMSEGAKKGSTNHALLPVTVATEDDDPTVVEPAWLPATNLCRG